MSKIIVDKCLKPNRETEKNTNDEEIQVVEEDSGEDILKNKFKGYRRVSPSNKPEGNNFQNKTNERNRDQKQSTTRERYNDNNVDDKERVQYCHFFNNNGRCSFAERFGRPCKFSHERAPVCHFDGQCVRPKCMFRHIQDPEHFLEQRQRNPQPRFPATGNRSAHSAQLEKFSSQRPWGYQGKPHHQ